MLTKILTFIGGLVSLLVVFFRQKTKKDEALLKKKDELKKDGKDALTNHDASGINIILTKLLNRKG